MQKKIVKFQKITDKKSKQTYWSWLNTQEKLKNDKNFDNENRLANADILADDEAFYFSNVSENHEILRYVLKNGALNFLSEQEYKVFHLLFREGFSLDQIGKHLEIRKSTVQNYIDRIKTKLLQICDDELDYQYK